MSNQTPRTAVRGIRQTIPEGHLLGRAPGSGAGAAQLIPFSAAAQGLRATGQIVGPGTNTPGTGTVTNVALSMPAQFSVAGSPITGSGTFTVTWATEAKNLVFAGPASGANAAPTFRALVGADLPVPSATTLGGVQSVAQVAHEWVQYIDTSGVPHLTQPAFSDISGTIAASQLPAPTNSALGGVEAVAQVSHEWVQYIDLSGVPHLAQPAFSDLSGNIATSQMNSGTSASSTTFWRGDGTWAAPAGSTSGASLQASPSNPTGTTSTTGKMMGLGGVCTIKPASSGKVVISISGFINNNTAGDGAECGIHFGTGTAPVNGAAPAGSAIGNFIGVLGTPSGTFYAPFCVQALVTGLVVGTTYWIDLDLLAVTGGTASVVNLTVCAFEVP